MYLCRLTVYTVVLALISIGLTQTTLNASQCIKNSGITTFAACDYLYDTIDYCAGPSVASGAPFVSCYCNQQVFNAFYE
jgi:hypothetical protein